jgi:MFS transporter, ceroid-lipofuscinosis neuronal protein 7
MTAPAPSQLGAAGREGPRGAGRYGSLPTHVGGAGATQQQQPPPQQQQQQQPPPPSQQRRRPLRAWYGNQLFVNLVELGSEGARGLVLPSLYMYQARLDGSTQFMCLLVAAFSLGRVISSTALGVMCDRHGMRRTYVVALLISAAGNALYALADVGCLDSRYALLAARFVVGFGAGNRAVCRADVAALTTAS